jgi:hypothetical protein
MGLCVHCCEWSFSRTFTVPGVVRYHDEVSKAAGVINVQGGSGLAIEYGFRSFWDYGYSSYFVTWFPEEIAALDGGAFNAASGLLWERTGETFNVWTGPASGALPTCRFFNATFIDHFYTPYAAECASVQANPAWHWQYEGIAFYLQVPDGNGNCPSGTTILYRLYNNGMGGVLVHRFTTSVVTFDQMLAEGWVFEGDSRTFAFACVPSSTATSMP